MSESCHYFGNLLIAPSLTKDSGQHDLVRRSLDQIIDMIHPLVGLSHPPTYFTLKPYKLIMLD